MLSKLLVGSSRHLPWQHTPRWTASLLVQPAPIRHICNTRPLWAGRPSQDHEKQVNVERDVAVQELRELYRGGLLNEPLRNTEAYRKRARQANRGVQLASATPWIDLRKHILSGEDGVDYARETMERFHAWTATLAPKDAQAEIEKASIGRQTLDWLLDVDEKTRSVCGVDYRLLRLLAHFVVAEREEEHLWEWIRRETSAIGFGAIRDRSARTRFVDKYSWIGRFLGAFAVIHLARNPECADKALQLVVELDALRGHEPGARAISFGALNASISRAFVPERYNKTSAALFDCFVDICCNPGLKGQLSRLDYVTALMSFLHPQRPDPDPLLEHFRSAESKPLDRLFNPRYAKEAAFKGKLCNDVGDMLEKRSRHEDAAWVRNFSKRFAVIGRRLSRQESHRGNTSAGRAHPSHEDDELETSPSDLMWMRKRR